MTGLISNILDNPQVAGAGYWAYVERIVRDRWPRWQGTINWHPRGEVYAYVNAARWIVHCPTPGCGGAFLTAPGLRFFCVECLNMTNDGHAYEIVFPEQAEWIEQVLSVRPAPVNRNWLPTETLDDLVRENLAHGLPRGL